MSELPVEPSDARFSFRGLAATAARYAGMSRALAYMLLARCWSLTAGPVSLFFVARHLSISEQGFYYTFWSVLGLWVFFDLGLALVLVQFASHERAALQLVDGRMTGDARAKERLASLLRLAIRWYGAASGLMLVVVLPAGLYFFSRYSPAEARVVWVLPWILVVVSSVANLVIGPLAAILEGSGLLPDVALMRLLQAVTANSLFWIALVSGAGLYSGFVLNGVMAIFNAVWLLSRHRRFFADLWRVRPREHPIDWRVEVWPFQWRFAVSWITSYAIFQLFNPILFAVRGPAAAGQMGMSLMVTTTLGLFAQSWVNARSVDYGVLVASRSYTKLDRAFRHSLIQSTIVILVLSGALLGGVQLMRVLRHPIADRILPLLPLGLLLLATTLNHVVNAEAAYLRAFKREPFMGIYLATAVTTAALSFLLAGPFGATGMVAALLGCVAVIGVGGGTLVFNSRRREWLAQHAEPAIGGQ